MVTKEAVQQSKIGRKRKVDNALNQKRRNIFGAKTNCETASRWQKIYIIYNKKGLIQNNKPCFFSQEAVQQFKIGRKRKADNALNQKRRNIFGAKTNCGTASQVFKTF